MSMKTATIHRPGTLPFVRFCGYFAVIAGLLGYWATGHIGWTQANRQKSQPG